MGFYCVPTEFLLAILCALMTLSQRSQCIYCSFTAFALRWRRAEEAVTSQRSSLCKCLRRPLGLHNGPYACLRSLQSSYCIVGDLTMPLWWPYGNPNALSLECWATVFVLRMLKVCTVVLSSLRSHSVYWRCHCVAPEMLAIILPAPQRSAFWLDNVGFDANASYKSTNKRFNLILNTAIYWKSPQ